MVSGLWIGGRWRRLVGQNLALALVASVHAARGATLDPFLWSTPAGACSSGAVAVSGGVVTTFQTVGTTTSTVVQFTDASGVAGWNLTMPQSIDTGMAAALCSTFVVGDGGSGFYVAGAATAGAQGTRLWWFVARVSTTAVLWQTWGNSTTAYPDTPVQLLVDGATHDVYVVGSFVGTMSFVPAPAHGQLQPPAGSAVTPNTFIARFAAANGTVLWATGIGSSTQDSAMGAALGAGNASILLYVSATGSSNWTLSGAGGGATLAVPGGTGVVLATVLAVNGTTALGVLATCVGGVAPVIVAAGARAFALDGGASLLLELGGAGSNCSVGGTLLPAASTAVVCVAVASGALQWALPLTGVSMNCGGSANGCAVVDMDVSPNGAAAVVVGTYCPGATSGPALALTVGPAVGPSAVPGAPPVLLNGSVAAPAAAQDSFALVVNVSTGGVLFAAVGGDGGSITPFNVACSAACGTAFIAGLVTAGTTVAGVPLPCGTQTSCGFVSAVALWNCSAW